MHRTRVDGPLRCVEVHLRDEGECLVRRCIQEIGRSLPLRHKVFVRPQHRKLLGERRLGFFVGHGDRSQLIGASGRSVLEDLVARVFEEDVDHDPL